MPRSRFIGACLLALLSALCLPVEGATSRSERAKAELDALRDKIDTVRHEIAADKSQRSDLSTTLAQAEADISAAARRLRGLEDAIAEDERRIGSLTRRRDTERANLSGQLDVLRRQVRAAYASGSVSRMRLLLAGESPEKLGRMLAYYAYFADAQTAQVTQLKQALADLAIRQRALENEKRDLARQRATRAETLARLEANQQQRRTTIAALDKRLSSHKASLDDLSADKQRLEKLLESLAEQLADLPAPVDGDNVAFARLKGHMTPPVNGHTLARFGTPKSGGPLKWQGEWLAADAGTPIRAVASGRVVYVGYLHRYGLIVILDHGHNYYTLYGHAESAYVAVGDQVRRGQAVAKAGHSGGHTRSGAYFEIRKGSTPINPAQWLSG